MNIKKIAILCLILFSIGLIRPMAPQAENIGTPVHANGELHAFYPSNAVFSEKIQQYIDQVDSLSFAWSRLDAADPGTLNTVKEKNGNRSFYYPADYLQPVRYAKSKGKSIQLNIYMDGGDGVALLPYADKRSAMVQAIVQTLQQDITPGEGMYYDGVVIDFEGLRDTDSSKQPILHEGEKISASFVKFLTELNEKLDTLGKKLYVAVNPELYFDGYDYSAILGIADRMIVMAHDYEPVEKLRKDQVEQYTGYDAIRPLSSPAPAGYVRQALQDIRDAAANPADLSRVWLQIAFDTAQWRYDVSGPDGWTALADSALSREGRLPPLYKALKDRIDNADGQGTSLTYGYNNELQSPFMQYYNKADRSWNVILYEDSTSIGAKLDLMNAYGLGGISVWSLANLPDYNDVKSKQFHLDGWNTLLAKMNTPYVPPADSQKTVKFIDGAVEQAVREKLDKPAGEITVLDVKGIFRLKLPEGVKSLKDLSQLVNLEYLDAQQLAIKDITAVGSLANLRVLYLQRNQISDINPLKKLTKLQILSLNGNQAVSLQPLANLTDLRKLYLRENKITSLQPLGKLTKLTELQLGINSIKDISALAGLKNLTILSLDGNGMTTAKGLEKMTKLKNLDLSGNKLTDINALKGLTGLENLYLQRNSISDAGALAGLKNLKLLSLNGNRLSNLKSLAALTQLTSLYLTENKISDLTSLKNLGNLQRLSLDKNLVKDIKPLAGLKKLTELYLPENKLSDITPLGGLLNLKILSLNRNTITDLKPLTKLTALEKLYLKDNRITGIVPLKGLSKLTELYLSGNRISDYSPVRAQYNNALKCDFALGK